MRSTCRTNLLKFSNNEVFSLDVDPGSCENNNLLQCVSANLIRNQLCRYTFRTIYFILVKCEIMITS